MTVKIAVLSVGPFNYEISPNQDTNESFWEPHFSGAPKRLSNTSVDIGDPPIVWQGGRMGIDDSYKCSKWPKEKIPPCSLHDLSDAAKVNFSGILQSWEVQDADAFRVDLNQVCAKAYTEFEVSNAAHLYLS